MGLRMHQPVCKGQTLSCRGAQRTRNQLPLLLLRNLLLGSFTSPLPCQPCSCIARSISQEQNERLTMHVGPGSGKPHFRFNWMGWFSCKKKRAGNMNLAPQCRLTRLAFPRQIQKQKAFPNTAGVA